MSPSTTAKHSPYPLWSISSGRAVLKELLFDGVEMLHKRTFGWLTNL
ncbi:hypothetical protein JYQ62_24140 [Nostoc sp. UHCC 0702]|nr:hypothetical protein JYQ62_24140 [Nostoc sp. UHCC 0702]